MTMPNGDLQGTENYVDNLEAPQHHGNGGWDLAAAGLAVGSEWYRRKQNKQLRAGEPLSPKQIRGRRIADMSLAYLFGRYLWWIPIVLYMVLDVFVAQPLHLATPNAFSVPWAIISLTLTIMPFVIIRRRNRHRQAMLLDAQQAPFQAAADEATRTEGLRTVTDPEAEADWQKWSEPFRPDDDNGNGE